MYDLRLIVFESSEYRDMVDLRYAILRKPLGLHFSPEYLSQEIHDQLIGCFEQGQKLIGCCVLSPVDDTMIRLRQMAVYPEYRGNGAGNAILGFAEKQAVLLGFRTIMMHARKTAVPFYEKSGYHILGGEFLEVSVPHFEMRKEFPTEGAQ